jgi:hypothetical protein
VRKLKFLLAAVVVIGIFFTTGCKKTTTTVVQDSVYYSSWTPLSLTMSGTDTQGDTIYSQQISAPAITAKFISKGAVLAYFGYPSQSGDTVVFNEAELGSFAAVSFAPGAIEIDSYGYDISYSNGGYLFRYVLIPGNVLTTSFKGMTQQQLNKMSFTDVQKTINSWQTASGRSLNP